MAALLVCAGHLRNAILVEWNQVVNPHPMLAALYGITGLGHQAVMVFFVLSGYLVGGSVLASLDRFRWTPYLIARLSRLWVVLIPCLLLTLFFDQITFRLAPEIMAGALKPRWHTGPLPGEYYLSLISFWGNVLFLQTIVVAPFGMNSPLWSLANEFWYYLLFPATLLALRKGDPQDIHTGRKRLLNGLLALCIVALMPAEMLGGFVVWLMGALVAYLQRQGFLHQVFQQQRPAVAQWVLALIMLGVGLALSKRHAGAWFYLATDAVLGLAVAGAMVLILHHPNTAPGRLSFWRWATERLSDISYSLYLSHMPLLALISACAFRTANAQPDLAGLMAYLVTLAMILGHGYLVWWLFERHTPSLRRWVRSRLQNRSELGRPRPVP